MFSPPPSGTQNRRHTRPYHLAPIVRESPFYSSGEASGAPGLYRDQPDAFRPTDPRNGVTGIGGGDHLGGLGGLSGLSGSSYTGITGNSGFSTGGQYSGFGGTGGYPGPSADFSGQNAATFAGYTGGQQSGFGGGLNGFNTGFSGGLNEYSSQTVSGYSGFIGTGGQIGIGSTQQPQPPELTVSGQTGGFPGQQTGGYFPGLSGIPEHHAPNSPTPGSLPLLMMTDDGGEEWEVLSEVKKKYVKW